MKKLTVMMDVIDKCNRMPSHKFQQWIKQEHKNLIEKEKQQMIEAHSDGVNNEHCGHFEGENYYNDTYKNIYE